MYVFSVISLFRRLQPNFGGQIKLVVIEAILLVVEGEAL